MSSEKATTLIDHFAELRRRMVLCGITISIFAGVFFTWPDPVFEFIIRPSRGSIPSLYFVSPLTPFCVRVMLAIAAGCVCSLPVVLQQAWFFVAPGLKAAERVIVMRALAGAGVLFTAGAALCYYVALPIMVRFLMGYQTAGLVPMITIDAYISFVLLMILAFGGMFIAPLALWVLVRLGVCDARALARHRPAIVIGIFIVAAVVTPPDPISQLLVALPVWALFEIALVIIRRKKHEGTRDD